MKYIEYASGATKKPQATTKNLWQNDLKSLRNTMRTLTELGSIKNSTLKQFTKPLKYFAVGTTGREVSQAFSSMRDASEISASNGIRGNVQYCEKVLSHYLFLYVLLGN